MKLLFARNRHKLALLFVAMLILGVLVWKYCPYDPVVIGREWLTRIMTEIRKAPFPLFIVLIGILPLAGVPVTALYLAAGVIYTPVYGFPVTFLGIGVGIFLNLLLSYWYARAFRNPVNKILKRFSTALPDYSGQPVWKLVLLIRFAPGLPQLVQNFILGILGVPLFWYLFLSLPAEMLIALGYITAGHSLASGHWRIIILGVGMIVIFLLGTSLVSHRRPKG